MIKKFIVTLICLITFPILVNADMGMPDSYNYDVIVTNPNGITAISYEGGEEVEVTLPYDAVATVTFEYTKDNILYLSVTYEDKYIEIKAEDVTVFEKEIDFSKFSKNKEGNKYLTIVETKMYNGPSKMYGTVKNGEIPANTTLEYEYSFEPMDSIGPMWIYADYEGTKGWVYVYSFGISPYEEEAKVYAATIMKEEETLFLARDAELLKNVNDIYEENKEVVATIKGGQFISYKMYTHPYPKTRALYVTVDGVSGWLYAETFNGPGPTVVTEEKKGEIISINKNGLAVYENYNDTTPVKGIAIPYLTKLQYTYNITLDVETYTNYSVKYKITYKDQEYWITGKTTDFAEVYSWNEDRTLTAVEDIVMYKYNNKSEKLDITIAKGSEMRYISEEYSTEDIPNLSDENIPEKFFFFVEYDGILGWVYSEDVSYEFTPVDPSEPSVEPEEPTEKPEEEEKEDEKGGKSMTPMETALICIGGAVILAITTIVVIVLFNKTKKEEPKIVQVNTPSDATIEHKELIRLLDRALEKEHIDSDATIEHKELVRLLDEALKKEHKDSAATMEHKELVRLLDEALELDKHIDSDATIEHKELVKLLDRALEKEHIDSDATIEHKELVRLLDEALKAEHIDSDATIEHKELVRLLDEALKAEHVDSDATIEHKELVRLLDEALELDKHMDSDATIEHKELVRLLDQALEKEKKQTPTQTPKKSKNKKNKR